MLGENSKHNPTGIQDENAAAIVRRHDPGGFLHAGTRGHADQVAVRYGLKYSAFMHGLSPFQNRRFKITMRAMAANNPRLKIWLKVALEKYLPSK
jgi:hypothetical protein